MIVCSVLRHTDPFLQGATDGRSLYFVTVIAFVVFDIFCSLYLVVVHGWESFKRLDVDQRPGFIGMQAWFNLLDICLIMRFCGHGDARLESIVTCNLIYNVLLSCL